MKFKKIAAILTAISLVFSPCLSTCAEERPSANIDLAHPDITEITYVEEETGKILKEERTVAYVMVYSPVVLSLRRTVNAAYIETDVFTCSEFTTVQVSTSRDFSKAKVFTIPNNKYRGSVLAEYKRIKNAEGRIIFIRALNQYYYGKNALSYRQIDITNNPNNKLIVTEKVANSIKSKISNRKTIRITGLDPRKRYYFRVKNLYEGFGSHHEGYPYRVASSTVTVTKPVPLK